jgi:hypothetical protein
MWLCFFSYARFNQACPLLQLTTTSSEGSLRVPGLASSIRGEAQEPVRSKRIKLEYAPSRVVAQQCYETWI